MEDGERRLVIADRRGLGPSPIPAALLAAARAARAARRPSARNLPRFLNWTGDTFWPATLMCSGHSAHLGTRRSSAPISPSGMVETGLSSASGMKLRGPDRAAFQRWRQRGRDSQPERSCRPEGSIERARFRVSSRPSHMMASRRSKSSSLRHATHVRVHGRLEEAERCRAHQALAAYVARSAFLQQLVPGSVPSFRSQGDADAGIGDKLNGAPASQGSRGAAWIRVARSITSPGSAMAD